MHIVPSRILRRACWTPSPEASPGDGYVFGLSSDLVDFIDIDNSALCLFDVLISRLKKTKYDVLNIVPHIARFRERGSVGNGKRNVKHACKRTGQVGFSTTGRAYEQCVAFLDLDVFEFIREELIGVILAPSDSQFRRKPFVVVMDGDGEYFFGMILTDDMLIEKGFYNTRFLEVENGFFVGSTLLADFFSPNSRSIMVLQTRTQESQMKTLAGPAIIFFTSLVVFHRRSRN